MEQEVGKAAEKSMGIPHVAKREGFSRIHIPSAWMGCAVRSSSTVMCCREITAARDTKRLRPFLKVPRCCFLCPGVCLSSPQLCQWGLIKSVIICFYVSCLSADVNWFFLSADVNWFFLWWELIFPLMGTDASTDGNWIFPLCSSILWPCCSIQVFNAG